MKKGLKYLFASVALSLSLGAVGVAGASVLANKEVETVEAVADTPIYLDLGTTNWGSKGANIYVHYWGGDTASSWPGVALSRNDFGLYTAKVDATSTGLKFHVGENWGGDCETGDLTFNSSKMLWKLTSQASPCTASSSAYSEKTIYVLDKNNNRLQVNHYVHAFGGSYQTTWPGISMAVESGRIYKATIPSTVTTVIFHNNEGNQTADLSIDGVCSVLESDWNGSKWVSLEAAKFIDNYMHFNDVSTETGGTTANCASYYSAAKTAYNALSSNAVRKEVLGVTDVQARLSNWATANHDSLDTSSGAPLAAINIPSIINVENNGLPLTIVMAVLLISGAAVGGFFFVRRRKEQ